MKTWLARTLALGVATTLLVGCSRDEQDWCCIRERTAACDLLYLNEEVDLPDRPLLLKDILRVAMKRNLDLFLKERELMVQREIATRDLFKILPTLSLNGELSGRDAKVVDRSKSLLTGIVGPGSIGREQATKTFDVSMAWSIVDFGLSFYRARQEHNRSLTICLTHKRTRQNLILDIVREYWRGVVAREAVTSAELILKDAEARRHELRKQVESKIIDEIEGLRHIDRLLSVHVELQGFEREYQSAKTELSSLMGILPSVTFELAIDVHPDAKTVLPTITEMEEEALLHRPELMAQDMEEHIAADDVRAAMLELLPNVSLFTGYDYDGDFYLLHNDWVSAGARVAYDLLNIPQHIKNTEAQRNRIMLVRESRLKISLGVITQVHLAHLAYLDAYETLSVSDDQNEVKHQLLTAALKRKEFGIIHGDLILDYEVDALFSEINELRSYAQVQIALEKINNAMGTPLFYNQYGIEPFFGEEEEQYGDWCGDNSCDCNKDTVEFNVHPKQPILMQNSPDKKAPNKEKEASGQPTPSEDTLKSNPADDDTGQINGATQWELMLPSIHSSSPDKPHFSITR